MSSCNNVNTTGSTTPGSAEIDFYLAVAKGDFTGYSNVSKFGRNPSVKSTDYETIWDGSNLYPWPTAAETLSVVSDDARTVEIEGLDSSWNVLTETVTMNGLTPVVTTGLFLRVYRVRVVTAGSTGVNEGTITCTNTTSSNVIGQISLGSSGFGQSLMALYTVPAGKTAYLINFDFSSSKDNEHTFRIMTRDNTVTDAAWNTKEFASARGGFNDFRKWAIQKYTEKTDLDFQAIASAASAASGGFELILIDN
jgi:hypothetical protein